MLSPKKSSMPKGSSKTSRSQRTLQPAWTVSDDFRRRPLSNEAAPCRKERERSVRAASKNVSYRKRSVSVSSLKSSSDGSEYDGSSGEETDNAKGTQLPSKLRSRILARQPIRAPLKELAALRSADNQKTCDETGILKALEDLSISTKVISEDSSIMRPSTSGSDVPDIATVRFSPPGKVKPVKKSAQDESRPCTPPASPTKSRLTSPRKQINRIPSVPGQRPSLDAFWNFDTVNDWNEQHSPKKVLKSPYKAPPAFDLEDPSYDSPSEAISPSVSPIKESMPRRSPVKAKTSSTTATRRAFNSTKVQLAEDFLRTLDKTITAGKVAEMTAASGGVSLIWSKKLNSTAGRANWRKEIIRRSSPASSIDGEGMTEVENRHIASIELAEKVIDNENRLYNVVAHEFCHLANFMISGIKDQPHGRSFQAWASKVTKAFAASHDVQVTTKHTYEISYKYIWACEGRPGKGEDDQGEGGCGAEYQRHSKSIDISKQRCGRCKGRLRQTKPVPRGQNAGGATMTAQKAPSDYQVFIKENFKVVQSEMGQKSPSKDVMKEVALRWGASKADAAAAAAVVEVVELDDTGSEENGGSRASGDDSEVGGVARKLNFLDLTLEEV